MFKRTLIRFGKPISAEELNIQDDSSLQLRRASRTIMAQIAQLREEACKELGLPSAGAARGKGGPPCGLRWPRPPGSALAWTGR